MLSYFFMLKSALFFFKNKIIWVFRILILFFPGTVPAMDIGINAHLLKMNNYDLGVAFHKIRVGGFKYLRIDIPWVNVESTKGKYIIYPRWDFIINELVKYHVKPIIILGYINPIYGNKKPVSPEQIEAYKKYVDFVVKHFDNKVFYYEPWNEWDSQLGGGGYGTFDGYKNILRASSEVIKQNPRNLVVAGSFTSDSFDKMLTIGEKDENRLILNKSLSKYFDIISIHPYTTARPRPYNEYKYFIKQVQYINSLMSQAGIKKNIFITEMGWSTANSGYAVSESEQYKLLKMSICDSEKLNVSAYIIYDLVNDFSTNGADGNNAAAFGLYNNDWSSKQSSGISRDIKCLR